MLHFMDACVGEYGAVRIYEGQIAILGKTHVAQQLHEMRQHEVFR